MRTYASRSFSSSRRYGSQARGRAPIFEFLGILAWASLVPGLLWLGWWAGL